MGQTGRASCSGNQDIRFSAMGRRAAAETASASSAPLSV